MNIKNEYVRDLNLFRTKLKDIGQLLMQTETRCSLEAMWLLGCLHEDCINRLDQLSALEVPNDTLPTI